MSLCIHVKSFWVLEATVWEYCCSNELCHYMPSLLAKCGAEESWAQLHTDTHMYACTHRFPPTNTDTHAHTITDMPTHRTHAELHTTVRFSFAFKECVLGYSWMSYVDVAYL